FSYKWVNDIYMNGHKVCGILTEATLELESASSAALIVGIGINLSTVDFPAAVAQKAGSIAPEQTIDRNQLAARLLVAIMN
ncbi:biotin--[acetyl-CoA-carboxylase] ligase, partial [Oliverpabstia sp. DFI.9.49]|nr:biotin--[acetyl-CoA-carboxylase] ligase [Oliverpabstia sp. DFI.9.49]